MLCLVLVVVGPSRGTSLAKHIEIIYTCREGRPKERERASERRRCGWKGHHFLRFYFFIHLNLWVSWLETRYGGFVLGSSDASVPSVIPKRKSLANRNHRERQTFAKNRLANLPWERETHRERALRALSFLYSHHVKDFLCDPRRGRSERSSLRC